MSQAISVRGLTKEYRIAHESYRPTTMGEALARRIRKPLQRTSYEKFRALDDVSFDVEKGEVLGVIGRNGAGKSTLLKILSRITEPTAGEVRLYGRIGSLLEVGTGFHPELTGRENIFLNGAILGMRRREIETQFDAIVEFAEVEKFLDTPVKRYSSGMYVRLAFAVAAHLNPEILVVDEVLSVGDAQFQKKCLGKMQDVSRQDGRTVLFVSHNMAAVKALCQRAVLLESGRVSLISDGLQAVSRYLSSGMEPTAGLARREVNGVHLANLSLVRGNESSPVRLLEAYDDYTLLLDLGFDRPQSRIGIAITVRDEEEAAISSICTPEEGLGWLAARECMSLRFSLPDLSLIPGKYWIDVDVHGTGRTVRFEHALGIEVQPTIGRGGACAYRPEHGVFRLARGGNALIDHSATSN